MADIKSLTITPPKGQPPLTVTVTAVIEGTPSVLYWLLDGKRVQEGGLSYTQTFDTLGWHTISCHVDNVSWTEVAVVEPPPVVIPDASIDLFTVEPAEGIAPLKVKGLCNLSNAKTWRWLKDGERDLPYDGESHDFEFTNPGDHSVGLRVQGINGKVLPDRIIPIKVRTKPTVIPYYGIQTHFRWLVEASTLAELKRRGWEMARLDVQGCNADLIDEMFSQCVNEGLFPLYLCTPDQVKDIPEGSVIDLLNGIDTTPAGLEPNFRVKPELFAEAVNKVVGIIKDRGIIAYTGMVNFDSSALRWMETLLKTLDPAFRIAAHPYPKGGAWSWYDRTKEIQKFLAIIGDRKWAVTEWGWNQNPQRHWWNYIFGGHGHLSETDIQAAMQQDFAQWERFGADFAVWFQLNDGQELCEKHPKLPAKEGYGIRRSNGTWKDYSFAKVPAR